MQNFHRGVRSVLELHVVYVHIVQFGTKEVDYHHSVALAIDCDGLTKVIFKTVRTIDAASPKSALNSNFLWIYCHLVNLVWVGVIPYMAIVLLT